MRKATSESWRISLSVSCDTRAGHYSRTAVENRGRGLRRGFGLEVLVRGAVVALGERRALARLALARGRPAAGDPAVEQPRLDLLLDEVDRGLHAFLHGPGDLRLRGDGEV